MKDSFCRNINYLRISVTDRCNLRCQYCMPPNGICAVPHNDILTFDEILRLVEIMASLGIEKIRLTGGEPLVRKGLPQLAHSIKLIKGIKSLYLTTNATLFSRYATELYGAGLDGVNISLDTLNPINYEKITLQNEFKSAQEGMNAALSLPFKSVKFNCVLSPYSTVEDWLSVVALAKKLPVKVRLIEWMPLSGSVSPPGISAYKALEILEEQFGKSTSLGSLSGGGPARYYFLPEFKGEVGFISAMSHSFCLDCNRIRLTSTGDLKLCLFFDNGIPLKALLRSGKSNVEIKELVSQAILLKPEKHNGHQLVSDGKANAAFIKHPKGMHEIGG